MQVQMIVTFDSQESTALDDAAAAAATLADPSLPPVPAGFSRLGYTPLPIGDVDRIATYLTAAQHSILDRHGPDPTRWEESTRTVWGAVIAGKHVATQALTTAAES